jgi:DNA-binding NarL/FixJ family response regulator
LPTEARIRVLVVDDHEVVRRGLYAFLEGEPDLEVVGDARGGQEALDAYALLEAEGRPPDVVLMDLKMAPIDGIETTRRMRSEHPTSEVVVLTSFGEEERVSAALEAGASGYLLKDADPEEISAAVRAACRGELQLDPAVTRPLLAALHRESDDDPTAGLTAREREVLRLVGMGKSNKEIAGELVISERTARTHVSSILRKIGVHSRTQAALLTVRQGLASAPDTADDE